MKFSIIILDFRLIRNPIDLFDFIRNYEIKKEWDIEFVFSRRKIYDVCFLDPITFEIIGFIKKGQKKINLTNQFISHINSEKEILELDPILDKINRNGIDSLTEGEKEFLEIYSKKMN